MANTDTILIVSPGYLEAVKSCLSRYTGFCIAAYSEVSRAIKALPHISGADLLGVAYLHDYVREQDISGIRTLMNKVNIMFQDIVDDRNENEKIQFLFLLSAKLGGAAASSEHLRAVVDGVGRNNLSVGYYNYDMMTDVVIKVEMFGSILLRRRPFESVHTAIEETVNNDKRVSISLPFEKKYLDIYEPLTLIEADDFLRNYPRERLLCLIRTYMYRRTETLWREIRAEIDKLGYERAIPYETVLRNLSLLKK